MQTELDLLVLPFREKAFELLARATEARLPVVIVNTLRTPEEQAEAVATGHSWVPHSKHQDGLAIDLCPLATYTLHGANKLQWAEDPCWLILGKLGERLGLRWGGRWKTADPGHFEDPWPDGHPERV